MENAKSADSAVNQ